VILRSGTEKKGSETNSSIFQDTSRGHSTVADVAGQPREERGESGRKGNRVVMMGAMAEVVDGASGAEVC